jgi:hypothetical protein
MTPTPSGGGEGCPRTGTEDEDAYLPGGVDAMPLRPRATTNTPAHVERCRYAGGEGMISMWKVAEPGNLAGKCHVE